MFPPATDDPGRSTDFLKLWAAQTLAALSANVTNLALPLIAALTLHASPFEMGLLGTMATIPNLLVGLFAGTWADRARRRPIMVAADVIRVVLLVTLPLASIYSRISLWQLYAVLFLSGICATFFDVANVAYLPSLVGRERLMGANSRIAASTRAASSVGPGLAGGLVQVLTAPIAVLVDAFSLALSAALTLAIRSEEPEPNPRSRRHGIGPEISAGLRPLYQDSVLRSITGSSMIYLFFSSVMLAVYVLYATRDLHIEPASLGLIFGVGGAGAVLGALVAAQWVRHLGIGPAMIVANLLAGLFTFLIPLAGDVPLASVVVLGVAQFAAQMMGAIFYINQISIRQVVTPDHLLGRMNAGYRFLTMGMLPVGSFVGGMLGETIGLKATLILGAFGMLLPSAWLLLSPLRSLNIEQSNRS